MMRKSIFIFILALSCRAPGAHFGLTTVEAQDGITMSTIQHCQRGEEVVQVADIALALAVSHAGEQGYLKYPDAVEGSRNRLMVCLIDEPEPCRFMSATAGPCKNGVCARKAGCASSSTAWAAKRWPPVCADAWPDEPHCLPKAIWMQDHAYDWRKSLAHEIVNMVALRFTRVSDPSYQDKFYGPGGPDQLVARDWDLLIEGKK